MGKMAAIEIFYQNLWGENEKKQYDKSWTSHGVDFLQRGFGNAKDGKNSFS